MPEVGRVDLLAIGDTNSFQTLSSSDLANCRRLGTTFFCEGRTVLKTNIIHDCMGSLFLASSTLIKANCKFRISDKREKIFSLGNNTWLVYSVGTIATNHVCPKARTSSPLTISSGQAVTVHSGCHIPTMDPLITADETEEMQVHSTWLDWTMSLSQLFDHNNAEQIANAVHQIRDTTTGSFDASVLLQNLDKLNEPFQAKHWIFSSPAMTFGLFAIITLLSFLIWKKFCTKPPTNTDVPTPSAPPILPVVQPAVNPNVPVVAPQQSPAPTAFNFKKSPPKSITIINS
jgi:hypothetical protein